MIIEVFETLDDEVNSLSIHISYDENTKTYTAATYTQSKYFRTEKGARNWLAKFIED